MQVVNPLKIFKQRKTLYNANLEFEKKDDVPSGYKPFETCHTFGQTEPGQVKEWLNTNSTNSFILYDPNDTAYTTCDTRSSYENNLITLYACADLPTAQKPDKIHTAMYVKITLKKSLLKRKHMVVTLDNMARAHGSRGRVFRLVDEHQIIDNLQNVDQTQLLENGNIVCQPDARKENMPLYRLERFHNWNAKQKSLGLDLGQTKRYLEPDTGSGKRSRMSKKQVLSLDQQEDKLRKRFDLWYGNNTMADVLFEENELDNVPNLDPASLVAGWEFWIANKSQLAMIPLRLKKKGHPKNIQLKDITTAWKVLVNVPKTVQSAAQLRHLRNNTRDRQRYVLAFLQDYLNIQPADANQYTTTTVLDILLARPLSPDDPYFIRSHELAHLHNVLAVVLTFPDKQKIGLNFNHIFRESIYENVISVCKLLLQDKNARGQYLIDLSNIGNRSLAIAAENGHVKVVYLLIKAENITKTDFRFSEHENEDNAMEIAATNGHSEIVSLLLDAKTFDNTQFRFGQLEHVRSSTLNLALLNGYAKVVSLLLAAKTLGDKKEFRFGVFPGDSRHESAINHATRSGYVELVNVLLEAKTIDEKKFRFKSGDALANAVMHNKPKVVALLLKAKNINNTEFRFNEVDGNGDNVLISAASNGHADTLSLLLEATSFDETEFRFFNQVDDDHEYRQSILTIARRGHQDTLSLLVQARTFDKKNFRFGFESMIQLITYIRQLDRPNILHTLLVAAIDRGQDIRNLVTSRYLTQLTGIS
jgi:ankyrin repeat protein